MLATTMLDSDWIRRRDGRGVTPTGLGRIALHRIFGLPVALLDRQRAAGAAPPAGG